eukprot:CAMPEP_0195518904 /NCGR_PEP_ID=MMETSP0794_2-20130614/13912_1 /TAXON_ID=515487 /ORGANISM="Stephanopyxis turris, Strain CCMP 815" /LENGTH=179 /DNA_ID=CAMNT_0040647949 /DNA_START=58 /DNA_END=597 /DNA_ORIENTATION=+
MNALVDLLTFAIFFAVLAIDSVSGACSELKVRACEGTKMEQYATGTFVPYDGDCEASPTYSKYKKKNGDPVYIFYKPASAKWYISHTGSFGSKCRTNLFLADSVIFDAAEEPYKETGDDDGEAKCNDGFDNDTNKQGFEWEPISIECVEGGGGGRETSSACARDFSFFVFFAGMAGFLL